MGVWGFLNLMHFPLCLCLDVLLVSSLVFASISCPSSEQCLEWAKAPSDFAKIIHNFNMRDPKIFKALTTLEHCRQLFADNCSSLSAKQVAEIASPWSPEDEQESGCAANRMAQLELIGCLARVSQWGELTSKHVPAFRYIKLELIKDPTSFQPDTMVELMVLQQMPRGYIPPSALEFKNIIEYMNCRAFSDGSRLYWQNFRPPIIQGLILDGRLLNRIVKVLLEVRNTLSSMQDAILWALRTETLLNNMIFFADFGHFKSVQLQLMQQRRTLPDLNHPMLNKMIKQHSPVNEWLLSLLERGVPLYQSNVSINRGEPLVRLEDFVKFALDGSTQAKSAWEAEFCKLYPQNEANQMAPIQILMMELQQEKTFFQEYTNGILTATNSNAPFYLFMTIAKLQRIRAYALLQDTWNFLRIQLAGKDDLRKSLLKRFSKANALRKMVIPLVTDRDELLSMGRIDDPNKQTVYILNLSHLQEPHKQISEILTLTCQYAAYYPAQFVGHHFQVKFSANLEPSEPLELFLKILQGALLNPARRLFRPVPGTSTSYIFDWLVSPTVAEFVGLLSGRSIVSGFTPIAFDRNFLWLVLDPYNQAQLRSYYLKHYSSIWQEHKKRRCSSRAHTGESPYPNGLCVPINIVPTTIHQISNVYNPIYCHGSDARWENAQSYYERLDNEGFKMFEKVVEAFNRGLGRFIQIDQLRYLLNPEIFLELFHPSPLPVEQFLKHIRFIGCDGTVGTFVGLEIPAKEAFMQIVQSLKPHHFLHLLRLWLEDPWVSIKTLEEHVPLVSCTNMTLTLSEANEIDEFISPIDNPNRFLFTKHDYYDLLRAVAQRQQALYDNRPARNFGNPLAEMTIHKEERIRLPQSYTCFSLLEISGAHTSIMIRAIGFFLNSFSEYYG